MRFRSPHDREILSLAVPAFGALIAEPLYLLADNAVLGNLGTEELDGFAIASLVLLIGHSVFTFLAYGTTAAVSRLLGAGETKRAAHQAVQSMWLAGVIGTIFALAAAAASGPLIGLLGGELGQAGPVRTNALIYLRISLIGFPALLLSLAGVGYLRGLQDTRRPFYVAGATAIFNLVLELILIFGFDQGIGASALSTVLAQWISGALYLWWVARAVRELEVGLMPDWAIIGQLAVAGRDLFLRTIALRGAFMVATGVAARLGGVELAAHQISFELWSFFAYAQDAVAIAAQAMVGRLLGAGDRLKTREVANRILQLGFVLGVASALIVVVLRPVLPGVFSGDPAVQALTAFLLLHLAAQQPLNGLVFALDGILIGANDLGFLARAMVVAFAVFLPLALLIGPASLGIGWLWAAIAVFMVMRFGLLLRRFRGDQWVVLGID